MVFRYRDHRGGRVWPAGPRRAWRRGTPRCGGSAASTWWGNAVRTEKLALLRRLLGVRPTEAADAAPPAQWEGEADEPPDPELRRLEEEQGTPRKCHACGGKMELSYQTARPTVAELLRMPPSMEPSVETGPLQLHLPISAFL